MSIGASGPQQSAYVFLAFSRNRCNKKLALKIFQNGGSYKTVAGNLGISRDKARTWKRLWQIGRFEDNIQGIRSSGDYPKEIKAKRNSRFRGRLSANGAKICAMQMLCKGNFDDHRDD